MEYGRRCGARNLMYPIEKSEDIFRREKMKTTKRIWELMDEYIDHYRAGREIDVQQLLQQCATEEERKELREQIEEHEAIYGRYDESLEQFDLEAHWEGIKKKLISLRLMTENYKDSN